MRSIILSVLFAIAVSSFELTKLSSTQSRLLGKICPENEDAQTPTHLPDPNDCGKFYKCDHGVPVLRRCPAGLWWNSAADWCDFPENSDCGNPGGINPSTEAPGSAEPESTESSSVEVEPESNESDDEENSNDLPEGCPADEDPQTPTHLPHPTECGKFYKCDHGVPVLRRCPAGLWWNSAADWCDFPENSDCGNPGGINPSTEAPGSAEPESTESSSVEVEPESNESDDEENSNELPEGCPADEDPQTPTHLPHPTDCGKFYKCDHGVPVLRRCPAGLWWNSAADWCDFPENSDCGNPGGINPSTEAPGSAEPESTESSSVEVEPESNESDDEKNSSELPEGCPADEDPQTPTHLPHPTECGKFYKCDHGVPVLRRCPAGLWWNSAADWCDFPENSDCGNPGGINPSTEAPGSAEPESTESSSVEVEPESNESDDEEDSSELPEGCPADEDPQTPTHLPHPTDCGKFYKCDHGVPVLRRCPAGLWWNSAADWCDFPGNSDCGNPGGINPSTEAPGSAEPESTESSSEEVEPESNESDDEEDSSELPEGCPADEDPQTPTHLPHPTECGKFYKCDHGVPVLRRCPAGLWWNSAADWCDFPENSDCGNPGGINPSTEAPGSAEPESTESSSVEVEPESNESDDEEDSSELPEGCPADEDPQTPTHLPHPTDCGKFYKCDHGVPVLRRCPAGLWWNSAADWCDFPGNSDCGNPGGINPSTEAPGSAEPESTESSSEEVEPESNESDDEEDSSELPEGCPADEDPQTPTHLPHPTECGKFYKCDHGVPVLRRCPAGLWWNSAADWCDFPENSDCGNPGGINPSTEAPGSAEPESTESSSVEVEPESNESDDEEDSSELPEGCPADEDPQTPTHLPHPTDCGKFYKCDHGVPVLRRCPAGLWWNSAADWCDFPGNSDCGNPGGINPSTEAPGSAEHESTESSSVEVEPESNESDDEENSSELPEGCPADEDPQTPTHLPHPTECGKFYKCDHGVPVLRRCPAGLWWNSAADWCDFPENSDCGNPGGINPSTEAPGSAEPESTESSSVEVEPESNESDDEEDSSELPEGCPADEDPQTPTHLPHPTDCGKFYKCDHGVPVLRRCPAGLWWNSAADWCDFPGNSDCGNPGGINPSTEAPGSAEPESTESSSEEVEPESNESDDEEDSSELPEGCPADEDPQTPTHLPHPTECGKFYKCDHGVPVLRRCPAGLWWNSAADWCDFPENSDCGNPGGINPSTEAPGSAEPESTESSSVEVEPESNESDDEEDSSELPEGCPADEDPQRPTHLPHPTECGKFYKCDHGVPVLRRCPAGLWWNSAADWCDFPENSDCGNPGGINPSTEAPGSAEPESTESSSVEVEPESNESDDEENSSELPEGCPADEDPQTPTHLPHPTECGKFYKCDHGVPVLRRCPAGLWWNSAADWCDFPENSDCGNPGGINPSTEAPGSAGPESTESSSVEVEPESNESDDQENSSELPEGCPADEDPQTPTHLPHPTECGKFYKCDHGVPVLRRCPAGLWWNSAADWCDFPENSDCGNPGGINPSTEAPGSAEPESTESSSVEVEPESNESDDEENSNELPEGCPADEDPQTPTHLPHPTECGKFYKCDHGVPVLRRCPAGLWWNSAADWCDFPENSDCGNPGGINPSTEAPGSAEPESTESSSVEVEPESNESDDEENSIELPDGCPADEDPQTPTHLPHPTECGKFYKCDHGVPVLRRCPAGLWWNSAADWCDFPENSDCGNPGGINPSTEAPGSAEPESTESSSVEVEPESNESDNEENSSELPEGCPADEDPQTPTHLPHPTECGKFYKCNRGVPVLYRCPAGLWWNSAADWCDFPKNSDCANPGGINPSTEAPEPESTESSSVEVEPESNESDDEEDSSELPEGCPADEDPQRPTHLPHPTECGKFYKCNGGVPVLYRCPVGLWWNSAADWCDYPEKSDCGSQQGNSPSTRAPESVETSLSENDSNENVIGPLGSCPIGDTAEIPMHLPHLTDCRIFYKCEAGVPVLHLCPAGLWWSSTRNYCDYPENSDCATRSA